MRKKRRIKRRELSPDPIYNSVLVSKFVNLVMRRGKKTLAQKIVYSVLKKLEEQHKKPALDIFTEVLDKVRPTVLLKARRVGGSNLQVPVPVDREKGLIIAMRWILDVSRSKKGKPIVEDLIKEINDVILDQGDVLKRREDIMRMVESNKAYSHLSR